MAIAKFTMVGGALYLTLGALSIVHAYEPTTHANLTTLAAQRSVIATDESLMDDLGLFPIAAQQSAAVSDMANGAIREDDKLPFPRSLNHFFDPQFGNFTGRALSLCCGIANGSKSPDWALEDNSQIFPDPLPQSYSYRDGQQYLYNALTSSSPADRSQNFALLFRTLGQVVHHIQDMAQPQHVRNEPHNPANGPDATLYERYTDRWFGTGKLQQLSQLVDSQPFAIPKLPTARNYFYTPGGVASYVGMAEFTALNFVSMFTGLRVTPGTLAISAHPEFPYPNAISANGVPKESEFRQVQIQTSPGSTPFTTGMRVIVGDVYDGSTSPGLVFEDRPLAVTSTLSAALEQVPNGRRVFKTNEYIYLSNYDILLPRAVAFSTGLINHFLRGRVDFYRNPAGSGWVIRNKSGSGNTLSGAFSVYYEMADQVRLPLSGASWSGMNLTPGSTANVTFAEPPAGTTMLTLVFTGRIGTDEPLPSANGFYSTAGQVIEYTPLPIGCGQPISKQGGSEVWTATTQLGSTAGKVKAEFEAYTIQDSIVIRKGSASGPVLKTTNGPTSGFHDFSWDHVPNGTDPTTIHITVTGHPTNADTAWTLVVGCPGQNLSNSVRPEPRISMSFQYSGTSGSGCADGYYEYYLNDSYVGKIDFRGGTITKTVTAGQRQTYRIDQVVTHWPSGGTCNNAATAYHSANYNFQSQRLTYPGGAISIQ
jgi:hypothetical protein